MTRTIRIALPLGLLLGVLSPAVAQTPALQPDQARWLPWLGCWQPDVPAPAGDLVCVVPDGGGVTVRSYSGPEVTFETRIVADGQRRDVARGGCTGWESASWSADGRRVYLHSELVCEGGVGRSSSGVLAMLPDSRWLDVQAVEVGGRTALRTDRYRPAHAQALADAGIESPSGDELALAIETARAAAGAELTTSAVIEAARSLKTEAVEALLVDSESSFLLDADVLVRLADAGVPERVIDLMIALSYPERFAIAQEDDRVQLSEAERAERQGRLARPGYRDPFGWDPYGWSPYRYDPWLSLYRDRYRYRYSPYGYGYGGWGGGFGYDGWGYVPGTRIVVVDREDQRPSGRLVKGRGYTRGSGGGSASPSNGRFPDPGRSSVRSGGSGSGGSTARPASGGSSSSGSSTGRTAKPRGNGNNN